MSSRLCAMYMYIVFYTCVYHPMPSFTKVIIKVLTYLLTYFLLISIKSVYNFAMTFPSYEQNIL